MQPLNRIPPTVPIFAANPGVVPGVNDDVNDGYKNGYFWGETSTPLLYWLADQTAGAALWQALQPYPIPPGDLPNAINATKIANGSVNNTEFQYLSTVTSNVQDQLNAKVATINVTLALTETPSQVATAIGQSGVYTFDVSGGGAGRVGIGCVSATNYGYFWQICDDASFQPRIRFGSNSSTWGSWLPFGGAALDAKAALSGTPAANQIAVWASATAVGGVANLLFGSGVLTVPGAIELHGSPASVGASVRNRHGNGGTTDLCDNVPTGGKYQVTVNGSSVMQVNGSEFTLPSGHVQTFLGALATQFTAKTAKTTPVGADLFLISDSAASGDAKKLSFTDLTSALGVGAVTGSIAMWGTGSAPTGYLLCDGSAVSRSTYSALFALLSTTFGAGNGSTTFNLPDFRGRAPIGVGTGSGLTARALADQVGVESVTLTGAQSGLPAHTHTVPGGDTPNYGSTAGKLSGTGTGGAVTTSSAGPSDASSSHTNMQPSLAVHFIIKT